jgi:LmbE family N-acetylglucosaminyl deacetylase
VSIAPAKIVGLLKRLQRTAVPYVAMLALFFAASSFFNSASGVEMKSDSTHTTRADTGPAILHELESFRQLGSALYIAAHPDDENTELLAYLARGRKYRTAYLSLTRGDGGQNVLGPEFGEKLGIARTQELLAARKIDGAHQYFSRAVDFGFSKDYKETLNNWDRQQVLSDIVRVIRQFHPDILITRFAPSPGGTHGHHTASTVLALEAFKLAGDPKAFPEQGLAPWQPKRIFWNVSKFQKDKFDGTKVTRVVTAGEDSVSGESFVELAERSRGMHKTQGFDTFRIANANEPREELFQLLDGPAPTGDIMDGVDTTWGRFSGGAAIGEAVDKIIAEFKVSDVQACVPALLKLRAQLNDLIKSKANQTEKKSDQGNNEPVHLPDLSNGSDPVLVEKRSQLDHILQECLGLKVETTISNFSVVPGETITLHHSATVRANVPVRWLSVNYPGLKKSETKDLLVKNTGPTVWESSETIPKTAPLAQPYWLVTDGTAGMFRVDDARLIGSAENQSALPIENVFDVDGQKLVIVDEPVQVTEVAGSKIRRRLNVISPVWLRFTSDVALLSQGGNRAVEVEVTAARANSSGSVELEAPAGWKISPPMQSFHLTNAGEHVTFKFNITAPGKADVAKIVASAVMNGLRYKNKREEVNYPHIPPQLLQSLASMKAVSFDLATRGHTIGYLPGAGDSLALNLQEMGYKVRVLDDAHLQPEQLHDLDAVVIGVRAFNVREHLASELQTLFTYVENGGTVIAQYNLSDKLKASKIAPYDLHLSRDRVTDEKASMTFLDPENPVLNVPNKITKKDFDGWVQERGLYFPDKWDDHFTAVLECKDPEEKPTRGALLVAKYGKGYFVYTGLSFFRQLPAGVPGAYRLLANLLALGK